MDPESFKTEELFRKVRWIVDKLNFIFEPQNFGELVGQVGALTFDTFERLDGSANIIFEKAICDPRFCMPTAHLCRIMQQITVPNTHPPITFRNLLITKCEREFKKDKAGREEKGETDLKALKHSTGLIRFLGELFKLKMLSKSIMHYCIGKLLTAEDESLECLFILLNTIGNDSELFKFDFVRSKQIANEGVNSARVLLLIQDLDDILDLKKYPQVQVQTAPSMYTIVQTQLPDTAYYVPYYVQGHTHNGYHQPNGGPPSAVQQSNVAAQQQHPMIRLQQQTVAQQQTYQPSPQQPQQSQTLPRREKKMLKITDSNTGSDVMREVLNSASSTSTTPPTSASTVDPSAAVTAMGGNTGGNASSTTPVIQATSSESVNDADNLRHIIIDGSNVAMTHGKHKIFSCRGIEIVVNYFLARGHKKITAMVPQHLIKVGAYHVVDREILIKLNTDGYLQFTPCKIIGLKKIVCSDDRLMVQLAEQTGGVIISNDFYRDLYNEKDQWKEIIGNRVIMYLFTGDIFLVPDDPLGPHAPRLSEMLSNSTPANNNGTSSDRRAPSESSTSESAEASMSSSEPSTISGASGADNPLQH